MKTPPDDRARLFAFLTQELDAFKGVYRRGDRDAVLKSLCHAVLWACALDEWLQRHREPAYSAFMASDPGAEVMQGLRFARNRAMHQFHELLYIGRAAYPRAFPIVLFDYRWKSSKDLPAPDPKHQARQRKLLIAYDARVAGKAARHTLAEVRDLFSRTKGAI